jgi:hypothetical protein
MSRMGSILNRLTGAAARHNRALDEVNEWSEKVGKFLGAFGLAKNKAGLGGLLENCGDAKFDLTGIAYSGRGLPARASDIKDKSVSPLVAAIVDNVENIRRYLMNPEFQSENLAKAVGDLRASFRKLHGILKKTSFL